MPPGQPVQDHPSPGAALERPLCWVNGLPADPDSPALPVSDRGFTLADGCFETMRAYRGVIFHLSAHLARMATTLGRLRIAPPPHLEQTVSAAARALRAAGADASVRLTISRGIGAGVAVPSGAVPTSVLLIARLPVFPPALYTAGLTVRIATGRRNEYGATAGLKTLSYTDTVMALIEATAGGADDALLLDTAGHLCEGTSSNVFVVANGVVHTPPRSCGVLPGVTREAVLGILEASRIPVIEAPMLPDVLGTADEVFLTSSLREIAPVTRVGDRPVGSGKPGPITRQVCAAYRIAVAGATADEMGGAA
jgi:branched-chain amino acid aminotransferase